MTTKITYHLVETDTLRDINLAPNSVGSSEIKDDAIIECHYANQSIPTAAYKLLSVSTGVLAENAVTAAKIGDDAILERHYTKQSIPASAYKLASIGTTALVDAAITAAKMAPASVATAALQDDAVTRAKIGDGAVGTDEIEDAKITPAKLQKGVKGDLLVATAEDGTFSRVATGAENAVLSVKNGLPTWTNNVLPTGTILDFCGVGAPVGWLLANGRTIGSASSSANNKSNDYKELFELLWNNFSNEVLAVSGGRGSSATADWNANKSIALPDLRGRMTVGRDAMASNNSNRIASECVSNGANADQMGASGGTDKVTLAESHIPSHRHFSVVFTGEHGEVPANTLNANNTVNSFGRGGNIDYVLRPPSNVSTEPNASRTSSYGGGQAHDNMSPFLVVTKIIKV